MCNVIICSDTSFGMDFGFKTMPVVLTSIDVVIELNGRSRVQRIQLKRISLHDTDPSDDVLLRC